MNDSDQHCPADETAKHRADIEADYEQVRASGGVDPDLAAYADALEQLYRNAQTDTERAAIHHGLYHDADGLPRTRHQLLSSGKRPDPAE